MPNSDVWLWPCTVSILCITHLSTMLYNSAKFNRFPTSLTQFFTDGQMPAALTRNGSWNDVLLTWRKPELNTYKYIIYWELQISHKNCHDRYFCHENIAQWPINNNLDLSFSLEKGEREKKTPPPEKNIYKEHVSPAGCNWPRLPNFLNYII